MATLPFPDNVEPSLRRPSASVPGKARRRRFLALDGVRGLAVIAVLVTHASYAIHNRIVFRVFQMGWTGVDLFFVLSGFLITGILLDTRSAVNRAGSFYARRVLRIFPIYYLTLGLALLAQAHWAWVAADADMPTLGSRLPYLFYYTNFISLWHHGIAHQTLLSHFWSLAVEEQFYFVWPLIVWHISTKTVYRLCGAALCFTLILRVVSGWYFGYGVWLFLLTPTRADGLFVGAGLAALLASNHHPSKRILGGLALLGLAGLATVAARGHLQMYFGGPLMSTYGFTCVALLCGVLIAYSTHPRGSTLSRAFETRWLCSFGRYSYGMYVFHLPVFYFVDHFMQDRLHLAFPLKGIYGFAYLGLLIAITYGAAWVSFHAFEQRFLSLKDFFEPRFTQPSQTRPPVQREPSQPPMQAPLAAG